MSKIFMRAGTGLVGFLLSWCAGTASAQSFTTYTDYASWAAAVSGTIESEDFNAAPTGNFSDPYVSTGYTGFCISGGTASDTIGIQPGGTGGNINGSPFLGWSGSGSGPTINFNLASQATAFAFSYNDTDPTDIWNIKILGTTYQDPPFVQGEGSGFFGIISDTPFSRVSMEQTAAGGVINSFGVDDIFTNADSSGNYLPSIREGAIIPVTMDEDSSPTAFNLTLNADDCDGDTITWSIGTEASNGTAEVSGTGSSKSIMYEPDADFNGSDSFTVQVSDDSGSTESSVNVTVNPQPEPPGAPAITAGIAGNEAAIIEFTAPGNDGGAPITSYTASCDGGSPANGSGSPLVVAGLTNGTEYNCSVVASNAAGDSAPSAGVAVTPVDGGRVVLPTSSGPGGQELDYVYEVSSPGTLAVTPASSAPPSAPEDSIASAVDIVGSSPGNAGFSASVTFTLPTGSSSTFVGFLKYGVESGGDTDHWYDYGTLSANGDGTGYEVLDDGKTLKVYFVDGVRGDYDLAANAVITDPGLPIVRGAAAIPVIPFSGLLLMAGLILLLALSGHRTAVKPH